MKFPTYLTLAVLAAQGCASSYSKDSKVNERIKWRKLMKNDSLLQCVNNPGNCSTKQYQSFGSLSEPSNNPDQAEANALKEMYKEVANYFLGINVEKAYQKSEWQINDDISSRKILYKNQKTNPDVEKFKKILSRCKEPAYKSFKVGNRYVGAAKILCPRKK